jgi:hypothetical protein
MKTRNFSLCALGLAAAITLGGASTASAQARSQTRIPVRKEAPPEVVRVDTIRIVRVDTVTLRGRVDTVTTTRYDTVRVMQVLPLQRLPGLYFGVGAGVAVPMNNWRNSTKDGFAIQGMVGWFPHDGPLGIRIDGLGDFFKHRKTDCPACPDPRLWEGNADVVLRFPLDRTSHLNPVLYFLGGGGVDKFSNFLPYIDSKNVVVTAGSNTYLIYPGLQLTPAAAGTKSWFFNYNVGGGLDWNVGPAHMYVESKYTTIYTTGGNSHYWPITAGFKFY